MLEILKDKSRPEGDAVRLLAFDAGTDAGEITFTVAQATACVTHIRYEDEAIGEGLLRAAYHMAADMGALYASCSIRELEPLLLKLHFVCNQDNYTANIVDIFKKCANCQS